VSGQLAHCPEWPALLPRVFLRYEAGHGFLPREAGAHHVDELRAGAANAGRVIYIPMDVRARRRRHPLNNAGFAIPGYIEQLTEQDYETMLQVNYLGAVRTIKALLPHFMECRAGSIVNLTSMLGFMGTFGYAAYAGSKFALSGYTECLRQDLLPFGISVHLCYPPTTKTPGLDKENEVKPPEAWAVEGKSRAFSPDDVATALLDGVRKKRFHILVGSDSSLIWRAQRFAPVARPPHHRQRDREAPERARRRPLDGEPRLFLNLKIPRPPSTSGLLHAMARGKEHEVARADRYRPPRVRMCRLRR
jgi:NAD(P)-dependent dehydrogenase (short-subunit alcohol dehydrogenase family)